MLHIKKGSAQIVMGAIAASAVSVLSSPSAASATTFNYSGSIDTYTVLTTGIYNIDVFGAQGGRADGVGGLGGEIFGNFNLTAGETLSILVGGAGGNGFSGDSAGGGGGTFVVLNGPATPLVIAGGGGGGVGFWPNGASGGGGGFSDDGGNGYNLGNGGGGSFLNGGGSGYGNGGYGGFGGFGGGGAGGYGFVGGGGGGFIGGNGGGVNNLGGIGGGGGSFIGVLGGNGGGIGGNGGGIGVYNPTRLAAIASLLSNNAIRNGNGMVDISFVSGPTAVPEPFTIIGTLIGGGTAMRMRKKLRDAAKSKRQ